MFVGTLGAFYHRWKLMIDIIIIFIRTSQIKFHYIYVMYASVWLSLAPLCIYIYHNLNVIQ